MTRKLQSTGKFAIIFLSFLLIHFEVRSQDWAYLNDYWQGSKEISKIRSLVSVLTEYEAKYNVRFNFDKGMLKNKTVNAEILKEQPASIDHALHILLKPLNLKYHKFQDNSYLIYPAGTEKNLKKIDKKEIHDSELSSPDKRESINTLIRKGIQSEQMKDVTVRGTVTSKDDGIPLPGVNVIVKGTTQGTTTDANGDFNIVVADQNAVLLFSFIGYSSIEVPVNGQSRIDVAMQSDVKQLSEVIVVGYGEQKKATLTGSISSVKGAEIIQSPATNVTNSLAGRLPGLVTITPSGEPGYDGSTLRIRGVNSLGNNDPLIVVDGIPGRSLERLDPNTIESITVLKDASAAIYGAQAANGVILVTTKRGKSGKPEVTINLNQGFGRPTRIPEMADAATYATMLNEIDFYRDRTPRYTEEEVQKFRDGSDPWRYPNTDWFEETLRPWSGQNYGNVQVNGGSENMKYFVSLGARTQEGYYKNSATKYSQYDFRSNLDGKISENFKIGFDIAGRMEDRNFPARSAGDIFRMVMRGKPTLPAYWPDGTPGPDIEYGNNPVVVSTNATGYDRDKWYYLQSNLNLSINIPWINGLSFTGNASLDKGFRFHKRFEKPWYLYSWDLSSYDDQGNPVLVKGKKGFEDPRLSEDMRDSIHILLNARLDYQKVINDVHEFRVMVGTERRSGQGDRFNAYRRYFDSEAVDEMFAGSNAEKDNGGSAFIGARLNYFGRINYSFREKYLFEFIGRYDGSYIFPKDKRFGFFPAVSAGWRISEENFWKDNISFFNNFKIRGSWGQTGNDRIADWQYMATYINNSNNWFYVFGINKENKRLNEGPIPNPDVTWEIADQTNIGFEALFLDNKFSFEADYFNYTRSQILWKQNASVPTSAGLTLPSVNIGEVKNRGFDFNIGFNDQVGDFDYRLSLNAGYQKNKITFWDESPGRPEWQHSTGRSIPTDVNNPDNDLYYEAIGIFDSDDEVATMPHRDEARAGDVIFKDVDGDGEITANDRVRNDKTNIPRLTGGFSLDLKFKQFDFAVLFQGAAGAVRYIDTESGEIGNFLKDFSENRWTVDNPGASYPRTFNRSEEYWRSQRNTFWLHKTDYLRLKNIQLGYSLPGNINERLGIQAFRIYISGLNLLTYSPDYQDFDPELSSGSGQSYPLQKVINGGITLTF